MVELRFLKKKNGDKILQARYVPTQISESACGDWVFEPQEPVRLKIEDNWTDWQDVEMVEE